MKEFVKYVPRSTTERGNFSNEIPSFFIHTSDTYKFGKSHVQKNDTKLGNEDALKRL